jgi:hypothetical protein
VSVKVVDAPRLRPSKSKTVKAFAAAHRSTIGRNGITGESYGTVESNIFAPDRG